MILPVRCFTCGKVLADKWEYYKRKLDEIKKNSKDNNPSSKEILDELGLEKYCCRRIMLGHVDLIDEI